MCTGPWCGPNRINGALALIGFLGNTQYKSLRDVAGAGAGVLVLAGVNRFGVS